MKLKYAEGPGKHHSQARMLICSLALWIHHRDSQTTCLDGLSHVAGGERSAGARSLELESRDLASGPVSVPEAVWQPWFFLRGWGSEAGDSGSYITLQLNSTPSSKDVNVGFTVVASRGRI